MKPFFVKLLSNNDLEIDHYSEKLVSKKTEIFIIGDLIGSIIDDNVYDYNDSKKELIKNIDRLNDFLPFIIGGCYLIIKSKNNIKIFSSNTSAGLLYVEHNNELILSNSEDLIYSRYGRKQDINQNELTCHILCHQNLIRSPFNSLFNNISKAPIGSLITIKNFNNINIRFPFLIKDMSFENSDQQEIYFEFLFENIISLYFSYYSQKKIVLAMSGGLDSSCILIASKIKGKIFDELYHVPYNNKNDFDLILSKEISRIIGYKLKVTQERKINLSYLKKRSSAGTAMILGPQYLKFNHIDYQWGEDEKIIQISGQNADTLYTIDNFNPGSSIIGLKRFISMIRTITYRLTYSAIFLSNNKINKFISDLIIKYNFKSNIKNNFYNYLLSTINSPLEHVVPLKNNNLKGAINDDYEIYKKKTILKPIIKIFSKINGNDIENYTINKKNKLVRFFRLVRTVNNVSINYNNLDSFEDILTLLPFQEGPLSFYFQNYILKPRDTFEIKRLFKKYFYKFFNKTHYSISKKAVQSSKMHNIELSKKIKSFIVKIFGWKFINYFSKIILNRKFNIEIKYKFQNEFDALTKMTNLNERFILNFLDNENFKLYFEKLYSEMLAKDDLGKYSRNKLMEFSRLINMDIYLRKIFDVR